MIKSDKPLLGVFVEVVDALVLWMASDPVNDEKEEALVKITIKT